MNKPLNPFRLFLRLAKHINRIELKSRVEPVWPDIPEGDVKYGNPEFPRSSKQGKRLQQLRFHYLRFWRTFRKQTFQERANLGISADKLTEILDEIEKALIELYRWESEIRKCNSKQKFDALMRRYNSVPSETLVCKRVENFEKAVLPLNDLANNFQGVLSVQPSPEDVESTALATPDDSKPEDEQPPPTATEPQGTDDNPEINQQPESSAALKGAADDAIHRKRLRSRKATVNERMRTELEKDQTKVEWISKKWAAHLKCGESSVRESETWKSLQLLAPEKKAELASKIRNEKGARQ